MQGPRLQAGCGPPLGCGKARAVCGGRLTRPGRSATWPIWDLGSDHNFPTPIPQGYGAQGCWLALPSSFIQCMAVFSLRSVFTAWISAGR